jgi:hypothetical protein
MLVHSPHGQKRRSRNAAHGVITGRTRRALPRGRPAYEGGRSTTPEIADFHLRKATAYLGEHGWSPELRRYVDDWLDWILADRARSQIRALPEAERPDDAGTASPATRALSRT